MAAHRKRKDHAAPGHGGFLSSRLLAAGSLVGGQCGNRFYGDGAWCPGGVAGGFWVISAIWKTL